MDRQIFPSALREVRDELTNRTALIALLGAGLVLGLSGPFGTIDLLKAVPRIAYWVFVAFTTYAIGSFLSSVCRRCMPRTPFWLKMVLSAFVIGTGAMAFLIVVNSAIFEFDPQNPIEIMPQWPLVILIAGIVNTGINLAQASRPQEAASPPPLLSRITLAKRGALIALSAEDHYVKVTTTNGSDMTLIRLSDAIKEVGDTAGLQIHRSHWVALDQVVDFTRTQDRGTLTLSNGETRPVSRSYMAAVRDAGLLPKARAHG